MPAVPRPAATQDSARFFLIAQRNLEGRLLLVTAAEISEDSGLDFAVFHSDSSSFSGMWAGGPAVTPRRKGYFCAKR